MRQHYKVVMIEQYDWCVPLQSLVGKDFLAKYWNAKKILAEKNFEKIKDVMKVNHVIVLTFVFWFVWFILYNLVLY